MSLGLVVPSLVLTGQPASPFQGWHWIWPGDWLVSAAPMGPCLVFTRPWVPLPPFLVCSQSAMLVTSNSSLGSVTPIVVTVGTFGPSTAHNASPAGELPSWPLGDLRHFLSQPESILSIVAPE